MQPLDLTRLSLKNYEGKQIYNLANLRYFVIDSCTKTSWIKRMVGEWDTQSWVLGAKGVGVEEKMCPGKQQC